MRILLGVTGMQTVEPTDTRRLFSSQIRIEAERVLEDIVFQRSPVQSKLLRYLVEASLRGGPAPSQYEIAVDALERDPDFDLANDSYPRVQISRLRNNLDNYYARNAPLDGSRLIIKPGQYRLGLSRMVSAPIASVHSQLDIDRGKSETAVASIDGGALISADAIHPEFARGHKPGSDPLETLGSPHYPAQGPAESFIASGPFEDERARARLSSAALVILTALLTIALFVTNRDALFGGAGHPSPLATAVESKPTVELIAETDALLRNDEAALDSIELAMRSVEIQLAYSFVSRPLSDGIAKPEEKADYRLHLDFARQSSGDLGVFARLSNQGGELVFSDLIVLNPVTQSDFGGELEAALIYITSPTGVIARDRFTKIGETPANGYECFLTIENQRADGQRVARLVDECIERFPRSDFIAFFKARRSYSFYQQRKLANQPIERSGQGWTDVQAALSADPFNAFANFTAAKIELANGNCDGAVLHIKQAFETSVSYPAMIAALEAEAGSCPALTPDMGTSKERLALLISRNPAPDPLLHVYLLVAALGSNDLASARALAEKSPIHTPSGIEEETIARLHKAIGNREFALSQADRIERDVSLFVWAQGAPERILNTLLGDKQPSEASSGLS